nr:hypothetical protein [Tanacetum cinerariifolium]
MGLGPPPAQYLVHQSLAASRRHVAASYWTAASDVVATSVPVNAAGHRRSTTFMPPVNDGHAVGHRSTAVDHGGDRRSTVAVNDGRRWRTTVDCCWTTIDHHRTIGQRWNSRLIDTSPTFSISFPARSCAKYRKNHALLSRRDTVPSTESALTFAELFEINDLKAQEKVLVITALKEQLNKLKGKAVLTEAISLNPIDPAGLQVDVASLVPKLRKNRTAHTDYIRHTQEEAATLREIVESERLLSPLNTSLAYSCKYTRRIQELLMILQQTCLSITDLGTKLVAVTPKNKTKQIRRTTQITKSERTSVATSPSPNIDSNTHVLSSTGVTLVASASGSMSQDNTKKNRIRRTQKKAKKTELEDHLRTVKSSLNKASVVDSKATSSIINSVSNVNSNLKCASCNACLFSDNHDACVLAYINSVNARLPLEVYALVSTHNVAKELWERIQMLMQGTSLTKQERECKLYDAFDKFAYQKGETLRDFYLRFSLLLNDMNMYNMKLEQFQVNTKFLNTLPSEWSKFVTDVKLMMDLHTTNVDQLHAYLGQHKYHANEVRLMNERTSDPLALISQHQLNRPTYQHHQPLHHQSQFQQQATSYQSSPYATTYHNPQFVSQGSSSPNLSISYPVNDTSSIVNHSAYMALAP